MKIQAQKFPDPFTVASSATSAKPTNVALSYWSELLGDVDPCHFPSLSIESSGSQKAFNSRNLTLSPTTTKRVHEFCQTHNTTVANFMSAIWALVLQAFTGTSTVCFGYLSSGRDVPVADANDIIGPLITMMIRKVDLDNKMPVSELIETMHTSFVQGLSHQHCSLAEIHHALDQERRRGQLFNTVVNVQRISNAANSGDESMIAFEVVHGHDPSEVRQFPTPTPLLSQRGTQVQKYGGVDDDVH